MRKTIGFLVLLCACAVFLAGCGKKAETPLPASSPVPVPVEVPTVESRGPLADAARKILDPYKDSLSALAEKNPGSIAHTIPGDLLDKMARDGQETDAQPKDGRYRFSYTQSSVSVYQATGLEVTKDFAQETRDPDNEVPMGEGSISDLSVQGGGEFKRVYDYDTAQDLSSGTMEITEKLDGEVTGRETFQFANFPDGFYFVDSAMELTAELDTLSNAGEFLVTVGRLEKEKAEIVEYLVSSPDLVPSVFTLDFQQLLSSVTPLSHLKSN